MDSNVRRLEKDLRTFAKRNRNITYTKGLLMTFLITGTVSLSSWGAAGYADYGRNNARYTVSEVSLKENTGTGIAEFFGNTEKMTAVKIAENTSAGAMPSNIEGRASKFGDIRTEARETEGVRNDIAASISAIRKDFVTFRKENTRLIKSSEMELIRLMEQGDQAVKSPWSSWQFGINGNYSSWNGVYKGNGDKTENKVYVRDVNSKFGEYSGGRHGATKLERITEPVASIPIDAGITPKNINKQALNIALPNIGTPVPPQLNVSVSDPLEVVTINPVLPDINPKTPSPNLSPFSDFTFINGFWDRSRQNDSGKVFWAGYRPLTIGAEGYTQGFGNSGVPNARAHERPGVLIYLTNGAPTYKGVTVHVAGNTGNAGLVGTTMNSNETLDGAGMVQNSNNDKHKGQIAFHLFGQNTVTDSKIYMYGKANAFSLETWQMHNWSFSNNNVYIVDKGFETANAKGLSDENVIFNIYPSYYETTTGFSALTLSQSNRGKFSGAVNADLDTRYNIVYSVVGNAGSFGVDSTHGQYNLEGAKNTMYSGLGYQANYGEFIGRRANPAPSSSNGSLHSLAGMKPYLNFDGNKISSSGDDNIIMFFADTTVTDSAPYYGGTATFPESSPEKKEWNKSVIGIYQGEIKTGAKIGTELSKNGGTVQTVQGNSGTDDKWVENNVGIFAASGQRDGISPVSDLGASAGGRTNNYDFSLDVIHSLQINGANFNFGKYSKNGVMVAAKNGTVVDVLLPGNKQEADTIGVISQTLLTDYGISGTAPVSSENAAVNNAATGTIIALSQGEWGNSGSNSGMSSAPALRGKATEINIGVDVEMSAKYRKFSDTEKVYPIAYAATDGGKVTAEKNTKALEYVYTN